jgi:AAA15 family ATPase/GTPase
MMVNKRPLEDYLGYISDERKNFFIRIINRKGFHRVLTGKDKDSKKLDVVLENGSLQALDLEIFHTGRNGQKKEFLLQEESTGVQRLFQLMPALYKTGKNDETIVIDELESSIHPILLINILNYFNHGDNLLRQLIFTTHESVMLNLDYLRQDEIWFVEKDENGASHLYSLAEFKPRFDKDIKSSYLQGRFGAIPLLTGNINFLEEQ